MKKANLFSLLALTIAIVSFSSIAYAKPTYTTDFNTYYGTDGVKGGVTLGSCITCHNTLDGDGYNPYGLDFMINSHKFEAIESLDSDGDGFDNITEIIYDTFPGDPGSVPAEPTNNPPVANAGADQTISVGDTITLDGSGSHDVDGNPLSIAWSFVSIPAGSSAKLSNPTAVDPTFVADLPGTYVAKLIVNDSLAASDPDTVTISTQNSAPLADAGPDQTASVEDTVSLDGSSSQDADGDQLTMAWSFVSVPAGSSAKLSNSNIINPTFIADLPGSYVAQLIVNDGMEASAPDTVTISTQNSAPVADAGPDQTASAGDAVTLDGSGSSDTDGDTLTFNWSFVSLPAGSNAALSDNSAAQPGFTVDLPGTYVARLVVNDGTLDSDPDTVTVSTGNLAPTADAGVDQAAYVGETITLDGSQSKDADGDPLNFVWSFASAPTGSTAALSDPTAAGPNFVVDLPGIYVAHIIVNDGKVDSTADTVTISTENSAPIADAGKRRNVRVGDTVALDGSQSTDPDGDPLTYSWSLVSRPETGSMAAAASAPTGGDSSTFVFVPDVPGTYVVQLIVNDGTVNSDAATCTVRVRKQNQRGNKGGRGGKVLSYQELESYGSSDSQIGEHENEYEYEREGERERESD